jgi:uncharacterized repeat protein (TIGR03803 family)
MEWRVGKLGGWRRVCEVLLLCAATAIVSGAQTFKTLVVFDGTNGSFPVASLIRGTDGDLYGTTQDGGAGGPTEGTVFKITPAGKLTTLHSFNGADGANPRAGMVQAVNGELYGTTLQGGANGWGTVFKITPEGKLATLYSFCAQTNCTDGANPGSGLIQVPNGDFYGTTGSGGTGEAGTVFKITPKGVLTTLHRFSGTDGNTPVAGLVRATNGGFYGTTFWGGANGDGTVFKITASGVLTTLYSFCFQLKCADGANPSAGLTLATDGNFYGTTSGGVILGDNNGDGTVFKITPGGKLATLHSFHVTDGAGPVGGLVQATNGNFYGTTPEGPGASGSLFRLSVGLRPFVETQPVSGKVGAPVTILGTDLTGATGVSFNGTAATFKIVSKSEITATVPPGATTGKVTVRTPRRKLLSSIAFRVTK